MEQSTQTLIIILAALAAGVWFAYRIDPMSLIGGGSKRDEA